MSDTQKIALITGANKGIGFEIARQLGLKGLIVLAGARDQTRGDEAARRLQSEGIETLVVHLDVTDQATINQAASFIDETYGKLDVLVNNAGISLSEGRVPPSELDVEVFRKTYETNVFGVFAVTKAMLPLLRRSDAGRIVNLSSPVGSLTLNSDP
ncbi:MAG TPA: SDR family NAD(P)-dependent oxidoreductase, partial [Ktedonobacteraceae bacterium]